METFWLQVQAPFAAFRGFQAGVYRSTSAVMPPSAAYGLVLNLAGIEMRALANEAISGVTTGIRDDIPPLRIAIGTLNQPERASIYQQLHGYRVGTDEKTKAMAALTKGAKYQIVPVRRELLVDYRGIIGVQTDDKTLSKKVEKGLLGQIGAPRYGLPFAGDNNYLFDRIHLINEPPANTVWYIRFEPEEAIRKGICRLTVGINRTDNSKTVGYLFAPLVGVASPLPESAWTWTPRPPTNAHC